MKDSRGGCSYTFQQDGDPGQVEQADHWAPMVKNHVTGIGSAEYFRHRGIGRFLSIFLLIPRLARGMAASTTLQTSHSSLTVSRRYSF